MLVEELARRFRVNGWTWTVRGREDVVPEESHIQAALDEAVKMLYDEPVGAQLEVGRLIIQKKHTGHDVYMFVGEYI